MIKPFKLFVFIFFMGLWACHSPSEKDANSEHFKIITAGGTITEIVYELGLGDQIIATDITSTYPAKMQELPSIGYRNQIKAEGILSLGPDMLLVETGYLPQDVVTQLESSGIKIKFFDKPKDVQGTKNIITALSEFLDRETEGQKLLESLDHDLKSLHEYVSTYPKEVGMAFVMARGQEMVFVAGEDTFAESLFEIAGITSKGKGFTDFIPLTPEALVSMDPDFLLFFDSGIASMGGPEGIKRIRGIEQTKAYQKNQIISFDGLYLSGFGPRVGKAALDLAKAVRN